MEIVRGIIGYSDEHLETVAKSPFEVTTKAATKFMDNKHDKKLGAFAGYNLLENRGEKRSAFMREASLGRHEEIVAKPIKGHRERSFPERLPQQKYR